MVIQTDQELQPAFWIGTFKGNYLCSYLLMYFSFDIHNIHKTFVMCCVLVMPELICRVVRLHIRSPIISNLCSGAIDLLSFGDRLAIDVWQEDCYVRRRHNRCTKRAQLKDATPHDRVAPPEICGECSSEMDHNPEQGEAHCP